MEIKGAAFVARKDAIIKQFGEDRWSKFVDGLAEKDEYFKKSILSTAFIPSDKFLMFQEAVVKEFAGGNPQYYWTNGEKSAEFALTEGPYKVYLSSKDIRTFVEERIPSIWKMYYNEGETICKVEGNVIDIRIVGVTISHIYFEYTAMAYWKRAIELIGGKIKEIKKLEGPSMGTKDSHYQFIIE